MTKKEEQLGRLKNILYNIEELKKSLEEIPNLEETPVVEEMPEESFIKSISVAEQTGGNIYNDIIYLKNGKLVVITGDGVFIFRDEEEYAIGESLKSYIFE